MSFFTNRSMTPQELTFKFLLYLAISYMLYNLFIKEYGEILMMVSSNLVATMFDMHVLNTGSYLTDTKLVSDISLQNSITHEIAHATLPLPEIVVDKIMSIITITPVILALGFLLIRSLKVLVVISLIVISMHIFSISSILVYFMFEASMQSQILTHYLQYLGLTQSMVEFSYIVSGISFWYLKFFTPLFVGYYVWEREGHRFVAQSTQLNSSKNATLSFIMMQNKGL